MDGKPVITRDQAHTLASLAAACRPDNAPTWDQPGILAALRKVHDRPLAQVALATIRAAADPTAKSPGVIASTESIHWQEKLAAPTPRPPRGDEQCPLHPGQWRDRCSGCKADQLTGTSASEDKPVTPEEARNRLQQARQQITTRPTPPERTDPR